MGEELPSAHEVLGSTASHYKAKTIESQGVVSQFLHSHDLDTASSTPKTTNIYIFITAERIPVKRLASLGRGTDGCWTVSPGVAQVRGLWLQYSWYRVLLREGPRFLQEESGGQPGASGNPAFSVDCDYPYLCRRPHLIVLSSISCSLGVAQAS